MKSLCLAVFLFLTVFLQSESLKDKLTVITTTSPIRSHPDTEMLEICQKSLFDMPGIQECPKIIVFDGIHKRMMFLKDSYEEYKTNVQNLTETDPYFRNTQLVFCKEHVHLTGAIKEAMKHVKTPFVFLHQHDFKIRRKVDTFGIIRSMEENPGLKHVMLPRRFISSSWGFNYYVDENIEGPCYVPLTRTFGWSDNDHFSPKSYYEEFIFPKVTKPWPMEWVLNPLEKKLTMEDPKNHDLFGTYIYGKIGDGRYIVHLDGKRWKK